MQLKIDEFFAEKVIPENDSVRLLEEIAEEIEERCKRDMNYIWLLNGEKAPNYRAICRFRTEVLSKYAEEIFYTLVHKLKGKKEIRFEHLFVDGTKIEANANKYSFVWKKSTNKYEQKVSVKIEKLTKIFQEKYGILEENEFEILNLLKEKHREPFVHGR